MLSYRSANVIRDLDFSYIFVISNSVPSGSMGNKNGIISQPSGSTNYLSITWSNDNHYQPKNVTVRAVRKCYVSGSYEDTFQGNSHSVNGIYEPGSEICTVSSSYVEGVGGYAIGSMTLFGFEIP